MSRTAPTLAHIGLGSNMGDRAAELRAGVAALAARPDVEPVLGSNLWESAYVGPGEQDPYLNACLSLRTTLDASDLLATLKAVEASRGRRPDGHMKPRPLDLDILLFGDELRDDSGLKIPHPRMRERAFVLAPLAQIAGDVRMPDSRETVREVYEKIRDPFGPDPRPRPEYGLLLRV